MKTDHILLAGALFILAITFSLATLSFRITNPALRVETTLYITYIFLTGVATLVIIEILHLAKKGFSKRHNDI